MEEILPLNLSSFNRSIVDRETGPDTKILITGYADLAVTQPPRSDLFVMKSSGLVLFVKDRRRRNFYIQVIDFKQGERVLDLKVCCALRYEINPQHPTAHTISEEGNCTSPATGLIFNDPIKANLFYKDVTERINHLRTKREARANLPSRPPVAVVEPFSPFRPSDPPLQRDTHLPLIKKESDPSAVKRSSALSKLEKIPNLPPPNPDELRPVEGTPNNIFVRSKKTPKKLPNEGFTARPRAKSSVTEMSGAKPKGPATSKPLPSLPKSEKITSPSSIHSVTIFPKQPPVLQNSPSSPATTDFASAPPLPKSQKPPVDRERKPNSAQSHPPISRKPSPTSPTQFNPLHELELKNRIAQLQKQPKFPPAATVLPTAQDSSAHVNSHFHASPTQMERNEENSSANFVFTNLESRSKLRNLMTRDTASPSPPPPPPPSHPLDDSVIDSPMLNDTTPWNIDVDFPPPPTPPAADENISFAEPMSNLNLRSTSPPHTVEINKNHDRSPATSNARGCLLAALQSDNPTARLRKTSVQNLPREEDRPVQENKMLAMLAQNLEVRRNAIDPIYTAASQGDTDEDDWSE